MKIAIVGSREYSNMNEVVAYVKSLPTDSDVTIVSGGARGVDRIAEEAAKVRGIATEIYPPDWDRYGKSAGYRRNQQIIGVADLVVAFWDGTSKGTKHSIDLANAAGLPLIIYQPVRVEGSDQWTTQVRHSNGASL